MPFKKGGKKPRASGREKGTSNKATLEIKTTCRDLLNEIYFKTLRARLLTGKRAVSRALCYPLIHPLERKK